MQRPPRHHPPSRAEQADRPHCAEDRNPHHFGHYPKDAFAVPEGERDVEHGRAEQGYNDEQASDDRVREAADLVRDEYEHRGVRYAIDKQFDDYRRGLPMSVRSPFWPPDSHSRMRLSWGRFSTVRAADRFSRRPPPRRRPHWSLASRSDRTPVMCASPPSRHGGRCWTRESICARGRGGNSGGAGSSLDNKRTTPSRASRETPSCASRGTTAKLCS